MQSVRSDDGNSSTTGGAADRANDRIRSTLDDARTDVEQAEARLEAVLAELRVAPRAEKVGVSRAIEEALERLRNARAKLSVAEITRAGDG